ncbi:MULTISPECIES: flavin reductase family protein [unclassified Brevibacterium]|uniref:flavin reductase family protein n=1 Tax=unclassified Brevibacterium TaxID=2614124 RepID=UPI0008A32DAC|nr:MULTISPECIES: flavin reductase family protein [unclassified Brevibacterium]OFL67271.1 hypothetical protein HMPREF2757_11265 [Brevibacterium sp. HMSC063G07]OFS26017.1 hypothetical protein HMPREF3162_07055 [Brevibacterium sp. HMSC07C04]
MDRPQRDSVGIDEYRRLTGYMSVGLAVLTCAKGSHTAAITVDSYMSVSWDPPTMAASVYSGSRMMEALGTARRYTLSVLSADQQDTAEWLGTPGQPIYGLLSQIPTEQTALGEVAIAGCLAYFTVVIAQQTEIATHTLVSGPVVDQGERNVEGTPLQRFHRSYGTFTDRH